MYPQRGSLVLSRYRLDEQVATGGMGVVWRATDTVLGSVVALKWVSFAHLGAEAARVTRERTLREARLAAKLRGHPHVVALYDVHVHEGDIWLVQEYLPSQSLDTMLAERGTLDPGQVAHVGAAVAEALSAAHAVGIHHRDITPGNVLISTDGTIKLTDFGVARSIQDTRITQTGLVFGTVAFLAPEVARGDEAGVAADLFSLGATLYTALEGQPPFGHSTSAMKLLHVVAAGVIRPPTAAGPLRPLLLSLLDPDPDSRPDAAGTAQSLRAYLAESAEADVPVPPPAATRRRRAGTALARLRPAVNRPGVLAAAVAAVVLVATAVIIPLARQESGERRASSGSGAEQVQAFATPSLPETVRPLTMPEDHRKVDPCALLRTPALERAGELDVRRGSTLYGCDVKITTPDGAEMVIGYEVGRPYEGAVPSGAEHDLGGLRVYPAKREDDGRTCKGLVSLADNSGFYASAYPLDGGSASADGADPCTAVAALTHSTARTLVEDGVPQSDFARNYPLAAHDACGLVSDRTLARVATLDYAGYYPEFGGWGCTWGDADDPARASVQLTFTLMEAGEFRSPEEQDPITVAGDTAHLRRQEAEQNERTCTVHLPRQRMPDESDAFQVVQVEVAGSESRAKRCGYAKMITEAAAVSLR